MQQVLKDFLIDAIYQVFGWGKPRDGKLLLTRHAVTKMHEHQLDVDTLADVFRHGEEGTNGKITRQYANYAVGLYYRYDEAENWLFRYLLSASIHAHFRPTPHESASYSRS